MRFDKRCRLIVKSQKQYDVELGKMVGGEAIETVVTANFSPIRAETINAFGDKLKDATMIVRVRNCQLSVDSLMIGNKRYIVVQTAKHRNVTAFYVSEVKDGKR